MLWDEVPLVHVNDIVFHQVLTTRIIESGMHDAWVPQWGSGAAVLRYYQNFSHLVAAAVSLATRITPQTSVVFVNAVFLAVYPATIYWAARNSMMPRFAAGLAAFVSIMVAADTNEKHLFGLQTWSFTWEGWGLYTQIVAAVWAFCSWGQAVDWVVRGKGFFRASVFLAFCWLSHLIVGYGMSAVTVVLVLGVYSNRLARPLHSLGWALARWLAMNLMAALLISYLIVPTMLEAYILNRSRFEPAEYWDSYGASKVFTWLFQGRLYDRVYRDGAWFFLVGDLPVFTICVMAALALIAVQMIRATALLSQVPERVKHIVLVAGAWVVAMALFTGRSTFGPKLLRLVPFSINLPFHRFFVHVHMFGILLAGWLLYQAFRLVYWACTRLKSPHAPRLGQVLCVVFFLTLIAYPMATHLGPRTKNHIRDLESQYRDGVEWWGNATYTLMKNVADRVHKNPGRAYAGAGWNWGKEFTLKFAKVYSLWTQRGLTVPNISYMWHAMGLNSEMDNHLKEERTDHHALYNLRYVMCRPDTASKPNKLLSEEHGGHVVYEWTSAKGYFAFIQLVGCVSVHSLPKDSFWLWREQFVMSHHTHALGKHYRTALRPREECQTVEEGERIDAALPRGELLAQEGNLDDFQVTLRCDEPLGCTIMVRVTYHPLFECVRASTGERLPTFAVAPSFIGFVAPRGTDTFNVRYRPPLWSKLLFWACYGTMGTFLILAFVKSPLLRSRLSPIERLKKKQE